MVAAATEWNPDPDAHGEVLRRLIKTRMEIARTIGTPPERRMRAQLADALKWRLKGQPPIPLYAAGPLDRRHPASPPMTYTQESAHDDPRYAALHRLTLQRIFSEPETLSYRSTPPELRGAAELYLGPLQSLLEGAPGAGCALFSCDCQLTTAVCEAGICVAKMD